jgi:hypothetical protein
MYTLKTILQGEVVDVIYSAKTNRVYLVLNPKITKDDPHYLYPLLCPLCGQPWHFLWNDHPHKLMALLKKSMNRFELVNTTYIPDWSVNRIESIQKQSINSKLIEFFHTRTVEHFEENSTYPAISLSFEILTETENKVSRQMRSDKKKNVENELDNDFNSHKEIDAIVITVHPSSILDIIVVNPELDAYRNSTYPYQAIINIVEQYRISKVIRL